MVGDSATGEEQLRSDVHKLVFLCAVQCTGTIYINPSFCVAFGSDLHFVNIVKTPLPKDYRLPPFTPDKTAGKARFTPQTLLTHCPVPPHPRTGIQSPPIPYLLNRYRNAQRSLMSIPHRTLTKHTLKTPASPPWRESSLSGRVVSEPPES